MYDDHETKLRSIFSNQKSICLTADIWTCKNRSFLGISGHYIDEITLKRKSYVLSCEYFPSPHNFQTISERFQLLYSRFDINPSSIIATVTDNGSNFVKAFKVFGRTNEEFTSFLESNEFDTHNINNMLSNVDNIDRSNIIKIVNSAINQTENNDHNDFDIENESDLLLDLIYSSFMEIENDESRPVNGNNIEDQNINANSMSSVISSEAINDSDLLALSQHIRCNSHNLNLIGAVDSMCAHRNKTYSKIYEAAFEKLNMLWDCAGRQESSEILIRILKSNLNRPNKTRWNWTYDRVSYHFLVSIYFLLYV